ncbi:sperm acrosome membrane-associated protein 6 [Dendrobates tinctorius]|uniref:sperm acrosome membrane-associated protein 6 n=1 Tax=Dendrobates tinctorius TaxID=92724 RepID=UPI003CC9A33A
MAVYHSDYLLRILVLLCRVLVTTSCLSCFTTPEERAQICEYPVLLNKISAQKCLEAIHSAFSSLDDILIAYSEIGNIRSYIQTFETEVRAISKDAWVNLFLNTTKHFVRKLEERITSNPPAKCQPPCGLQKAASTFICSRCAQEDCTFPVTCPIEVVRVGELDKSLIPCGGIFDLPEFLKVIWKYARDLKTTDLRYFSDIFSGEDLFILIEPSRVSHIGTYVCDVIDEDDDIILRRFTYLDVVKNENNADNNLEEDFQLAIQSKTPEQVEEEKKNEPSSSKENSDSPLRYAIYAAICCLIITLVFGYLWRYSLSVDWSRKTSGGPKLLPFKDYGGHCALRNLEQFIRGGYILTKQNVERDIFIFGSTFFMK